MKTIQLRTIALHGHYAPYGGGMATYLYTLVIPIPTPRPEPSQQDTIVGPWSNLQIITYLYTYYHNTFEDGRRAYPIYNTIFTTTEPTNRVGRVALVCAWWCPPSPLVLLGGSFSRPALSAWGGWMHEGSERLFAGAAEGVFCEHG